jgi:hypothetical protein
MILTQHPPGRQPDLNLATLCPHFERCCAAYCPAAGGTHLKGEPVCLWLRESVKPGGRAKITAALRGNLAEVILSSASRLLSARGPLADELRRASKLGSKVDCMRRIRGGLSTGVPGGSGRVHR